MAAFATEGDLQTWLDDTVVDTAQAQMLLEAVSDEIRDSVGWSVTEEVVTLTLDGPGDEKLLLPTLHLTAVTSVTEDSVALTAEDYLLYERGYLTRMSGHWPVKWTCRLQGVTVVFTHGYPDGQVPGVFQTVTLETVARMLDNPGGSLKSKTVGRVAVSYADAKAASKAGADSRLDYYRLPEGF